MVKTKRSNMREGELFARAYTLRSAVTGGVLQKKKGFLKISQNLQQNRPQVSGLQLY